MVRSTPAFVLLAIASPALAQPATFHGVGHPPGIGESRAAAVSADGRIIVGAAGAGAARRAFRFGDETGLELLSPAPGWGTPFWSWAATAVSGDGSVIVGFADHISGLPYTRRAFRWTSAGGMADLGALPGGISIGGSIAADISDDGAVIVGHADGDQLTTGRLAFRWSTAQGMHEFLPAPRAQISFATAISGDGATIVGGIFAEPFRWSEAGGLHMFGKVEHAPSAVSSDGQVIVGGSYSTGAFRWTPAGMQYLGTMYTIARAVSGDGLIIVGAMGWPSPGEAFIWDETSGVHPLADVLASEHGIDLAGWELHEATGISADGRTIVGFGRNPCGQIEGWVVRLGTARACPADCDRSGTLNIDDFTCFIDRFAAGHPIANCDHSCITPVLNIDDFTCFINQYAVGCP